MQASVRLALSFSAVLTSSLALSQTTSTHPRQQTTTVGAHSIYGTPPAEENMLPMPLVAPVFLQTDQIDSSITVVNSIIWGAKGTITLRDQQGDIIAKATPTFPAHSSTVVSLKKLLTDAGSLAHSGSVTLEQDPQVKGPALLAQLSMTMHVGSQATYLEEEFGMPTMHGSAELRGVASETKNFPLIAITSVSEASQTIHATCIGESPADPGTAIELPAYGTAVVHACVWDSLKDDSLGLSSALQHAPGSPLQNHAVSLKTDSVPGAFYAFGFALNGSIAQAQLQPLDFYDPGLLPSTQTVYVGVPFGPESRLLKQNFSPTLTLANFSTQPRSTTVTVADSSSGTPKSHQLAQITIPALSTKTVHIPSESGTGLLNSFIIASDGQPGDVQAHLFSNRDSAEDRLELLAKDARDDHNGGDHPWSIEDGNTSTLLLYNPTPKLQEFQVRISGNNVDWVQLYQLAPSETRAVSINDIIIRKLPDLKKTKLPPDLSHGDVDWLTPFGASGLGRLLVTNEGTGLKRNFSCPKFNNMCTASLGPFSYVDFPDGGFGSISTINVGLCTEQCATCCGQTSSAGASYSFSTQWQNTNNGVTALSSSSNSQLTLQGINLGTFSITALVSEGSCSAPPMGGGGGVQAALALSRANLMQVNATGTPNGGSTTFSATATNGSNIAGVNSGSGNPSTATLTDPANSTPKGTPTPGGLALITGTYTVNGYTGTHSFSVPTFGVSCYYTAFEGDWGVAPNSCKSVTIYGTNYTGAVTNPNGLSGTYCSSFIGEVKLQGSATLNTGQAVQYIMGSGQIIPVSSITAADGTVVIAGQTLARDRSIIPRGGYKVDVDGVGTGLLANDVGQAITGYRLDLYKGAGQAVCSSFNNVISVAACNPGISTCPAQQIP